MKCLSESKMSHYLSGAMSEIEANALRGHISRCLKCRCLHDEIANITNQLKSNNADYHSDAEIHKIMTIIDVGKANTVDFRPRPRINMSKIMAIAALLVASLIGGGIWFSLSSKKPKPNSGFQSRSDGASSPDSWVSLQIFENRNGKYYRVKGTISSSAALAFRYEDYSHQPYPYLMILAVDVQGRIFWYYPPYLEEQANPHSISLNGNKGVFQLPDEVFHDYSEGEVTVIGIFSRTPLNVRDVERVITKKVSQTDTIDKIHRVDLQGTAQYMKTLTVETQR